jgi:hypothetical protein
MVTEKKPTDSKKPADKPTQSNQNKEVPAKEAPAKDAKDKKQIEDEDLVSILFYRIIDVNI